ncbi:MAG: TonB family protein [Methylococcaceae bacterium]|jgi:TonB family C-terminal domain
MALEPEFGQLPPLSSKDSLLVALFFAAILHVGLILGLNFEQSKPEKINRPIDITLVSTPAKKPPKEAQFLAPANQIGAGEAELKKPQPPQQKLASQGDNGSQIPKNKPSQVASKPKAAEKLVTQKVAEKAVVAEQKAETGEHIERPKLTAEALRSQIAELGNEIRQRQESAVHTRVKFVNSVSAHQFLAAQYMQDWENKVERTGNLNYPKVAAQKNFSGTLTMDVGIKTDGSIYSIRINRSSGNPALDEAAKNIVRISAPFAPLPNELRKELDVLVITRVWKFSDESGITTQ